MCAVKNTTILERAYLANGNDYQQRVGDVAQSNITRVINNIFNYTPSYNQFMSFLVNRIGDTIIHSDNKWDNRLKAFGGPTLDYGNTIQELAPAWIKSHTYNPKSESLLKKYAPEGGAWFHEQNRQEFYPITISRDAVRSAFTDEYGLNRLLDSVLQVAYNSDNYDEYRIMLEQIAIYNDRWGFYSQVMDEPTTTDSGANFLTSVRSISDKMYFPSTIYNATDIPIPVFAKKDELILLTTPDVKANISVRNLAAAFNISEANIESRMVLVDEFPVPNMYALLTTKDFFVQRDTEYTTTEFFDARTLSTNYYLHHWGVYSCSPYVPACAYFASGTATVIPTITITPTAITATSKAITTLKETYRGNAAYLIQLTATVSPSGTNVEIKPNAVTYEIAATDGTESHNPVELDAKTYISLYDESEFDDILITNTETRAGMYAVLHVSDDVPTGTVISITFKSAYINPSGSTTEFNRTVSYTVA